MIRNFLYLDSEKLRSISSQLFEGVTEQVVSTASDIESQSENQKGPVASGKLLGDIFSKERSSSELRFLEDHAYTLFEKRLHDLNIITGFEDTSELQHIETSFIKITAKLQINDISTSASIFRDFNKLGEAFWRVTNEEINWSPSSQKKVHPDPEVKKKAGEAGLQMNQKVSDAAALILNFGYQDLIEANLVVGNGVFSAPLKREFLREPEQLIVHKYSRNTQGKFSLVGIVTQQGMMADESAPLPDVKDADGIKQAMRLLASHLRTFENEFAAPGHNEVIVDPIAIYSVL